MRGLNGHFGKLQNCVETSGLIFELCVGVLRARHGGHNLARVPETIWMM
jgi:hypothetical protein